MTFINTLRHFFNINVCPVCGKKEVKDGPGYNYVTCKSCGYIWEEFDGNQATWGKARQ